MRRLIINADDFGLTSGVNRAIVEAHTRGLVTSATLMATAEAFDEAVKLSYLNCDLEVGCHVVLIDGSPITDAKQVPSLINRNPHFRNSAAKLGLAAWAGHIDPNHVTAEATSQISKLQSAGIPIAHLDTHKHVHMFPKVLQGILSAAQACGVRAIRNPFEPVRFAQFTGKLGSRKRWLQVKMLATLAADFRRSVETAGLATPDGSLGIVATGSLDEESFCDLIQNCPEGTWELVCHPGYIDQGLDNIHTRLRQSRVIELDLLTSTAARDLVKREGIELISYRDIA